MINQSIHLIIHCSSWGKVSKRESSNVLMCHVTDYTDVQGCNTVGVYYYDEGCGFIPVSGDIIYITQNQ